MQSSREWHPHKEHQRAASVQQGKWSGPQFFTLEKCAGCQLHKIVRAGEVWPHSCKEDESILRR